MDRKIEVGATYRLPDATAFDVRETTVYVNFGCGGTAFPRDWFATHATLVKAAERPLAVGDLVRLPKWTKDAQPRPIVFVGGAKNEAVIDLGDAGLSAPYRITELRRAETT